MAWFVYFYATLSEMWNLKAMQLLFPSTNTKKELYGTVFFHIFSEHFWHFWIFSTPEGFHLQISGNILVNRGDAMGRAHGFTRIAIFRVSLGWHHVRVSVGPGVAALRGETGSDGWFFERFCRFLWTVVVGLCLNPTFSNHDCLDTWWKTYLQPSGKIQVWPFRRGRLWPSLCGLHVSDLVHRPVEAMKGATSLCFFRAQFSWQRNTFILCVLNQLSQQISIQWWVKDDNKNLWTSQTWTFIL